jgi:hypothetical protein
MPPPTSGKLRCGSTFNENKVPLGQGGLKGVLRRGTNPLRHSATAVAAVKASQAFTPSDRGFSEGSL